MSDHMEKEEEKLSEIQTGDSSSVRCLVFESGPLCLFLDVNDVSEIITGCSITPVPMVPAFVKGILNLRGQILPVVDIRLYMGHEELAFTNKTCIIVLQTASLSLGILVDSVQQVMDIDLANVRPVPKEQKQSLLNGMVTLKDGRILMSFDYRAFINDQC